MTYIFVRWFHDFADDPILLYSELGEGRYETRKVDVFKDGRVDVAGPNFEYGDTGLGVEPVPPLDEIAADLEFSPREITKDEFEAIWHLALRATGSAA